MNEQHGQYDQQDPRIDAALDFLRQTCAPEGIEARVMARVRQHTAASQKAAIGFNVRRGLAWGGLVAAVAVTTWVLTTGPQREKTAAPEFTANGTAHPGHIPNSETGHQSSAATVDGAVNQQAPRVRDSGNRHPLRPVALRLGTVLHAAETSDSWAQSYPAPPSPLTQEERLLLHLAHTGDRGDLAMLDPVRRAAQTAAERAEVQSFFGGSKEDTSPKGSSE